MIQGLGTVALLLVVNLLGLVGSLWLDRRGLPAAVDDQTTPRKRGILPERLPLILLNLGVLLVGAGVGPWLLVDSFPLRPPGPLELLGSLALIFLLDDLWFYWMHRLIHENKWLYRRIHRIHHKAYAPVPIEYIYVHPLEWMLGAGGPIIAITGIIVVTGEMSIWTFWAFGALRTLHELDIHSGTRSVLARWLPLYAPTRHHDLHHARPTLGNYASTLTLWDRLLGTRIDEDQVRRRRPTSG